MANRTIDFDNPQTLYKINPDGESATLTTVIGKKAIEEAISDGWMIDVPRLRYDLTLYNLLGETKVVHNRAEEEFWMLPENGGWDHVVRAPVVPTSDTVDLTLAIQSEQEKRRELEVEMAELKDKFTTLMAGLAQGQKQAPEAPEPQRNRPGRKPASKPQGEAE